MAVVTFRSVKLVANALFAVGFCLIAFFSTVLANFGPFGLADSLRIVAFLALLPGVSLWAGTALLSLSGNLRAWHVVMIFGVIALPLGLFCRPYAPSVIHYENFKTISPGMSRAEVMEIMARSRHNQKDPRYVHFRPDTADWRHDSDIATIEFENDRVVYKSFSAD